MAGGKSPASLRPLFLSGVGALYFIAFYSYYLQFPGLFGADGITPAQPYLARLAQHHGVTETDAATWDGAMRLVTASPSLLWVAQPLDIALDAWLEGLALFGCFLSLATTLGLHHVGLYAMMFLLYLSPFAVGQSMLSFQWDIFLLETGFATIFYAPIWGSSNSHFPPMSWVFRFQLFKIMFMSGIVKTQADCPTWKGLTALEYHFASQCIPTAEAWWAHQLPPFLLRIGVAATFVTQVPAPFLLLAPAAWCRRLGVLVQGPLQFLIMLTGNYNWFNLHVLLLCIPVWEADTLSASPATKRLYALVPGRLERFWQVLWTLAGVVFLLVSLPALLHLHTDHLSPEDIATNLWTSMPHIWRWDSMSLSDWAWTTHLVLENKFDIHRADILLAVVTPWLVQYLAAMSALSGLCYIACHIARCSVRSWIFGVPYSIAVSIVSSGLLGLAIVPLSSIHRPVADSLRNDLPFGLGHQVLAAHRKLEPFSVTSGYGLFRRMTGVGRSPHTGNAWGGKPPSVVDVPAIVLEGSLDNKSWEPLHFRYVPSDVMVAPRRIAPLQPRLDWRMWFAALGNYQHDPWIIHLAVKLMKESPDVLALMDIDRYPFSNGATPRFVRATKYTWDFTRLDTPWAKNIPGVQLVKTNSSSRGAWWQRKGAGQEYMPPISLGNPSVSEFLGQFGWKEQLLLPQRADVCSWAPSGPRTASTGSETMAPLVTHTKRLMQGWCRFVVELREPVKHIRRAVGWTVELRDILSTLPAGQWLADSLAPQGSTWDTLLFFDAHLISLLCFGLGPLVLLRCLAAILVRKRPKLATTHRVMGAKKTN